MTDTIKTVCLTTPQRELIDRIRTANAAGGHVVIEHDKISAFLSPEVAAVLDGTAVPEESRRDAVLHLLEAPSNAGKDRRDKEVYLVEGHSSLV